VCREVCASIIPDGGIDDVRFVGSMIGDQIESGGNHDNGAAAGHGCHAPDQPLQNKQGVPCVLKADFWRPLHSADRNGDAGGNAEHVSFFGTDDSNELVLHHIWDDQIVARIQKTYTALPGSLTAQIATAAAEPKSQPMDWALEAYVPARDTAYNGIPEEPAKSKTDVASLGQPYQDAAAPVVKLQIARAGVRLADALDTAFATAVNSRTKKYSPKSAGKP
jgi:hypothetical protein